MAVTVKKGKKNQSVIIQSLTLRPLQRTNSDITAWKNAIVSADMGRRSLLLTQYEELKLDTRLSSVAEKRVLAITNSEWVFTDANGQEVPEINELMDTPAFENILEESQNHVLYGHTLLEITRDEKGDLKAELVPRKHVKSEIGMVVKNENDTTGFPYREAPYSYYILEVGQPKGDYGLLLKAAPYVILKKGNISDWAQFNELFGMPQRIGKYDASDKEGKAALEQSLESAGSAAWIAIPKETDLEIKDAKGSADGKLYDLFRHACNEELTILFLGQTMTTDNGSSRSQGEVHLKVEESLYKKDRRKIRRILNQNLLPILENLGYPVTGGKFSVKDESKLSTKEKIEILDMVKANTPVSDDEYYSTSGVPKPDNYDELKKAPTPPVDPAPIDPAPVDKKPMTKEKPKKKGIKLSWESLKSFFSEVQ